MCFSHRKNVAAVFKMEHCYLLSFSFFPLVTISVCLILINSTAQTMSAMARAKNITKSRWLTSETMGCVRQRNRLKFLSSMQKFPIKRKLFKKNFSLRRIKTEKCRAEYRDNHIYTDETFTLIGIVCASCFSIAKNTVVEKIEYRIYALLVHFY